MKTSKVIREEFLKFFENKLHVIVPSAPVVPFEDPTLLFTNAGMNQFKDIFLAKSTRQENRIVNSQKCIRVSGKHNDLEEVGIDTYHHTFFEMLGNWSFGDSHSIDGIGTGYYKEEAIKWAWELLTEIWKLPKERLYATVYKTDDEAFNCWKTGTDINPSHILRFGEKDNFWEMGEVGPCGPCSEVHINLADDYEDSSLVNAGTAKCIEIWNLVFIQYNRLADGQLEPLRAKHVDTGMGFERIVAVLQEKNSNYDTDIFRPIIKQIEILTKKKYDSEINQIAMRVISDHIRTLTFAITDGAFPSNEGRGYVLRRILRRASRFARKLEVHEPILYKLVDVVIDVMGEQFPEIVSHKSQVKEIIKSEEESFSETLDRGLEIFDNILKKIKYENSKIISGDDAFKLYDTYGFPIDLTELMAREQGFDVDKVKFETLMQEQKDRSRESGKFVDDQLHLSQIGKKIEATKFLGYDVLEAEAKVLFSKDDIIILDQTPFYAESGGQVGDKGELFYNDRSYKIIDTIKEDNLFVHKLLEKLEFPEGASVFVKVDKERRHAIMSNHSATHILHQVLRNIFGAHVKQSGSYVYDEKFRFDFTHFKKLTKEEIKQIENIVNSKIRESLPLNHMRAIDFNVAKNMGALMFFGDKYGDKVNVVKFGDFSVEFCGGTHVKNTSEIGMFKILSEASISSGVRRIEAVTGKGVELFIESQDTLINELNEKINNLFEEKKSLEKEINKLKISNSSNSLDDLLKKIKKVDDINYLISEFQVDDLEQLKKIGDKLREKMSSGVGILYSIIEEKINFVCVVSDDLIKQTKLSAGKIVGDLAKIVGGGGGGRSHLATAGGKDLAKLKEAIDSLKEIIKKYKG